MSCIHASVYFIPVFYRINFVISPFVAIQTDKTMEHTMNLVVMVFFFCLTISRGIAGVEKDDEICIE